MQRAYAFFCVRGQLSPTNRAIFAACVSVAVVARAPALWPLVAVAAVLLTWWGSRRRQRRVGLLLAVVAGCSLALFAVRVSAARSALEPQSVGPTQEWFRVVDDPQTYRSATRVIFDDGDQRVEYWARGRARRIRVSEWAAGDRVLVVGTVSGLDRERQRRVAWQHVVASIDIDWVGGHRPGSRLSVAANRARDVVRRGSDELPADQAALFRGLVIGDDSDQPAEMVNRFRASGLSHLTAVSGQNVAFLLAAAGPVLRRLRVWARWWVTIGLIAWFVVLTRMEPSILRAGVMAGVSATGFALGRERVPTRTLAVSVIALLALDPLLSESVGFVLSVGATAGVLVLGPWLAARLCRLGWLASPVGITLGAQCGVAVPSLLVFGRLPLVSVPANLLAGPVAGAVMFYGLPAGILAGAVPWAAPVLMFPCRVGVRWVDAVAAVAAAVEPGPRAGLVGWSLIAIGILLTIARSQATGSQPAHRLSVPPTRSGVPPR